MDHISRNVKERILEAVEDTRIVVSQGARQVGETTLAREIVEEVGGRFVTLDDSIVACGARMDPVGFLDHDPDRLLTVDEVQRVPELVLVLKLIVDRDKRLGRFLLTGSGKLLNIPTVGDSLAGRT